MADVDHDGWEMSEGYRVFLIAVAIFFLVFGTAILLSP